MRPAGAKSGHAKPQSAKKKKGLHELLIRDCGRFGVRSLCRNCTRSFERAGAQGTDGAAVRAQMLGVYDTAATTRANAAAASPKVRSESAGGAGTTVKGVEVEPVQGSGQIFQRQTVVARLATAAKEHAAAMTELFEAKEEAEDMVLDLQDELAKEGAVRKLATSASLFVLALSPVCALSPLCCRRSGP